MRIWQCRRAQEPVEWLVLFGTSLADVKKNQIVDKIMMNVYNLKNYMLYANL